MPAHSLNTQRAGWEPGNFPPEISGWAASSTDKATVSSLHGTASRTVLNGYAAQAIIEYAKGELDPQSAKIALVDTGNGMTYSAEAAMADRRKMVVTMNRPDAKSNTITLRASILTPTSQGDYVYTPVPPLTADTEIQLAPIFVCLLAHLLHLSADAHDDLSTIFNGYVATSSFDSVELEFRRLCDALTGCLDSGFISISVPGNNIDMLVKQSVALGSLAGTVIFGQPEVLMANTKPANASKLITFSAAKKKYQSFAQTHQWTEQERQLIPVFPDDYMVPEEALKIADLYVNTREDRRPMNNFMWRGTTSFGKSTGVELLAGFLDIPLLRVTCYTSMETQDLLSNFVPDTSHSNFTGELPSFMEISADPASAYLAMTGEEKDDATCDECLEVYGQAVAAKSQANAGARFIHVESNYVKALTHGYIVEVQECSRIKDPGVLVGLNEFDRPGAVIPLVDGSFKRRNPNAMVVYTDNVGYASCRPIDPSVLRRMAIIIDSYELPKDKVLDRVRYNTGFKDSAALEQMYDVWLAVQDYCKEHDISDGTISVSELEMWVLATKINGMSMLKENCRVCLVAKATAERSEQDAIMADVIDIRLA